MTAIRVAKTQLNVSAGAALPSNHSFIPTVPAEEPIMKTRYSKGNGLTSLAASANLMC